MTSTNEDESPMNGANQIISAKFAAETRKRRRNTRACDACHKSSYKCSPDTNGAGCRRCKTQGVLCTYNRPIKRRGPQSRRVMQEAGTHPQAIAANPSSTIQDISVPTGHIDAEETGLYSPVQPSTDYYSPYENSIKPEMIESLVDVFHYLAYPILPYFHWPTYRAQIQQQLYRYDLGLFVVTMSVCSLGAVRLCEGLPIQLNSHIKCRDGGSLSAECYDAAVQNMPTDFANLTDYFLFMKAMAILSSSSLQKGDLKNGIIHLGNYSSLSTIHSFHMEQSWPIDITEVERQERRRLFWGVYQQEQYIANKFDRVSRQREVKTTVCYPAEVYDDEDISDIGIRSRADKVSFLRGWNFCTDLYRLIEQIDVVIKERQQAPLKEPGSAVTAFLAVLKPPEHFAADTLNLISKLHKDLPNKLKKVTPMTGDIHTDRYGFIASNILITTQTLKMLLVGAESSSVHQRCAIASELLDELSTVPLAFFHASSTCSLHHLAHVGHLLGSVIKKPLSSWAYLQVRHILLVLSNFLDKIESNRPSSPGLASKLQAHIRRIDQCRLHSSQHSREPQIISSDQNPIAEWTNAQSIAFPKSLQQPLTNTDHIINGTLQAASVSLDVEPTVSIPLNSDYLSFSDIIQQQVDLLPTQSSDAALGLDATFGNSFDLPQPFNINGPPGPATGSIFDNWPW